MSSTIETLFPTLFPIFIIIATIVCVIYFLIYKKQDIKKPNQAKKPRFTQPAQTVVGVEGFSVAGSDKDVKEGFSSSGGGFPVWPGPSVKFGFLRNNNFYRQYAETNLQPSPELIDYNNSLPISDPQVPNYGSSLSKFDSNLSSIPWDADNVDYLQTDIVWGDVSRGASASIFMKTYVQNLLSDPNNIQEGAKGAMYHSYIMNMDARDPAMDVTLQFADALASHVASTALETLKDSVSDMIERKRMDSLVKSGKLQELVNKLNAGDFDAEFNKLSARDASRVKAFAEQKERNDAREKKLTDGTALDKDEVAEHNVYKKVNQRLNPEADDIFPDPDPPKPGAKVGRFRTVLNMLSGADKIAAGARKMAKFLSNPAYRDAAFKAMRNAITNMIKKFSVNKIITASIATMSAVTDVGAVATFGALAPLAIIIKIILFLWNVLDILSMVITLALQVLLPTLMEKSMQNGAVCSEGKPLDALITDDFLYFLISELIPLGSVMDVFGPYVCYKSDGGIIFKTPLYVPPYFADSSLSTSKHIYPPNLRPRGDSTSYKSNTDSLPPGWTITAGIARSPCDPGTWTSSDVDMLCNISTYVPETYVKKSAVPVTRVKTSRVPTTDPKTTYITTRSKWVDVGIGTVMEKMGCPVGTRDDGTVCWGESGSVCGDDCSKGWDNCRRRGLFGECWGGCRESCSSVYLGARTELWQRLKCPAGKENVDLLCYNKCPEGLLRVGGMPYLCERKCTADEDDWVVLPLCTAKKCEKPGYDGKTFTLVLGICWENCGPNRIDVGALCRNRCNADEYEVLGVCWKGCNANETDVGALCRSNCTGDTPNEVLGVCWGSCGNDIDVGALCRKRCREGFHEVAGVCWGNTGTYARQSMIPKSVKVYDPGYNPHRMNYLKAGDTLDEAKLGFPYCDFGSPAMMNRMAQFYYNNAVLNAESLEDGRSQFEYIVMIYGVIASSELSCDIACAMKTVKFDPLTGDRYEESYGTKYDDDVGNTVSYRRFYFYRAETDTTGMFTVTGCTHTDYTAPDAQDAAYSTAQGVDPIISVPKVFNVIDKQVQPGTWDMGAFKTALAATTTQVVVSNVTSPFGIVGAVGGGVAGGMAAQKVTEKMNEGKPEPLGAEPGDKKLVGNATDGYFISSESDNFSINHGPIYEKRAVDKTGYVPVFNFCEKVITGSLTCADPRFLQNTIDLYQTQNPNKHIKTIYEIEPRGKDGCYYRWSTTSYDAATNIEGTVVRSEELVRKYVINDFSTCVFSPTNTFVTDLTNYPIRSYFDILKQKKVYPTRNVTQKPTVQGRFIRIRPSLTAPDGFLQLSQVAVYNMADMNVARGRPVFASSQYSGSDGMAAPPNKVVDGKLTPVSGLIYTYQNSGSAQNDYLDIDLGMSFFISKVVIYGRSDSDKPTRNSGIRVQILNAPSDPPTKELLTTSSFTINTVDFTTKIITPKLPVSPLNLPRSLPPETTLINCPSRCQDKAQINSFVEQFNNNPTNANAQIIKVTKAITPTPTRCEYEAEIVRNTAGKKTVAKELLSSTVSFVSKTPDNGLVYGRYVRIRPSLTNGGGWLHMSQIVVNDATGRNIALKRPVYTTSRYMGGGVISPEGSIVTDGNLSSRGWPTGIWHSGSTQRDKEYLEIDLGITQGISSITFYGGNTHPDNTGVRIQILDINEGNILLLSEKKLVSGSSSQLIETVRFESCAFSYTNASSTTTFIQDNTPPLESLDSSGGILTFQNINSTIANLYNSIVNPIKAQDPTNVLATNIQAVQTTTQNTLNSIAANQTLEGCPNVKCSDPAVLTAIASSYNNTPVTTQYGTETRKIVTIAKAGVAGPNTCDVLFTELYSQYDDYLYDPYVNENTTVAKRFRMTNTGNCAMTVTPGGITDVSMNAVGIMAPSSVLTTPFTPSTCQVNCRDTRLLSSIKQQLNTQYQTPSTIPNFNRVTQSFAKEPNFCEYMFSKDVTTKNLTTGRFSTETGLETYVTALFDMATTTCTPTLKTVTEYDPELITSSPESNGGLATFIKGVKVVLPFLFNYDDTTPSNRVNQTQQIIS